MHQCICIIMIKYLEFKYLISTPYLQIWGDNGIISMNSQLCEIFTGSCCGLSSGIFR